MGCMAQLVKTFSKIADLPNIHDNDFSNLQHKVIILIWSLKHIARLMVLWYNIHKDKIPFVINNQKHLALMSAGIGLQSQLDKDGSDTIVMMCPFFALSLKFIVATYIDATKLRCQPWQEQLDQKVGALYDCQYIIYGPQYWSKQHPPTDSNLEYAQNNTTNCWQTL